MECKNCFQNISILPKENRPTTELYRKIGFCDADCRNGYYNGKRIETFLSFVNAVEESIRMRRISKNQ